MTTTTFEDFLSDFCEKYGIDEVPFSHYCDNFHLTEDDLVDGGDDYVAEFQDAYIGEYDGVEHFSEQWADEEGFNLPDYIRNNVDWDGVWQGYLRHDFWEADDHFFRNV